MSTTAAQYRFAAEYVTVVVAVAGLIVAASRSRAPGGRAERLALAAGFAAGGVAAFVLGATLAEPGPGEALGWVRVAGAVAVLAGSRRWAAGARSAWALRAGAAAAAAAGAVQLAAASPAVTDALLVGAAAAEGVALAAAGRRSVATQVAAAAAATLLAVVLVVSLALGSVITSSVEASDVAAVADRAQVVGTGLGDLAGTVAADARFGAEDLVGYFHTVAPNPLVELGGGPGPAPSAAIAGRLQELSALDPGTGFAYADPSGTVVAATGAASGAPVAAILRAPVLAAQTCPPGGAGSVVVAGGAAWEAGVYPECLTGGTLLGAVVALRPLDAGYLAPRRSGEVPVSLALVAPSGVVAASGPGAPAAMAASLVARARTDGPAARVEGGRILAARAVGDGTGRPVLVLLASTPAAALDATTGKLFKTLFLIALGGTVLALVLAAAIGERITAGIRSLTAAARRVRRGDTAARAAVRGSDEVAVLGDAFDAMVVAIEAQTEALQVAGAAEVRLRNRLETVVAGMGDALVAIDASGRITDFNRAAEELSGVAAGDATGRPVATVLEVRAPDGRRLPTAAAGHAELAFLVRLGPDGSGPASAPVPVAVSVGPLHGPGGERAGAVLVLHDRRGEYEIERMKSEFLSRVGHELRTPLTGIIGYADLLLRAGAGEAARARGWHEEIRASGRRLERVVEMLEFVAGTGAGRVQLRPESLDVGRLLDDVAAGWSARSAGAGRVVASHPPGLPPVVADARWLRLAVDELVDNAVKFSPPGGEVRVAARAAGTWVDITVCDRGQGMTDAEVSAAFGAFAQGDGSDTREAGGLGLGLTLVQRVAEGHGGTVGIDTAPGEGSVLTVRLPAAGEA